jgi:hypothetical protein
LFGASPTTLQKQDVEAVGFIERVIVEAGQARLAAPRHHYYHFEAPVSGRMAHFSLGSRFPYSLYWWTGVWFVLCFMIAVRARLRPAANGEPNATPSGGPATQLGNSGVTKGPPSVS